MCHFDNFDIDQIASKLAQRWNFVHSFYCKKISVLDSFDNAKNAKRHLFFGHPILAHEYGTKRAFKAISPEIFIRF